MLIKENFMLHNDTAVRLYHDCAKDMPIFDYHCHLPPKDIADNRQFEDLTAIWLAGDHYKWRAMRTLGIDEEKITGNASSREKFQAYAQAVPQLLGSPIYHWTHLELNRPFGINDVLLNEHSAEEVWQRANHLLAQPEFTTQGILQKMNVAMIGTTDDPIDTLEHHQRIARSDFPISVRPSFRPDQIVKIDLAGFVDYFHRLEAVVGSKINSFSELTVALRTRLEYFKLHGCVASDHGVEILRYAEIPNANRLNQILADRLAGKTLSETEIAQYQSALMLFFAQVYCEFGWVMQLHIGAMRNNNARMFAQLGADSGFDSIGDRLIADNLSALLNAMDKNQQLPKTILYNLNPRDYAVLATMCGNFQGDGIRGKVQFGSGWWFNDQKDGMIEQLKMHAQMGVLSVFVGMLTDSRSFLSYTRHEYFRRILCQLIGQWAEDGEIPKDMDLLGVMVKNICYHNAKNYFQS